MATRKSTRTRKAVSYNEDKDSKDSEDSEEPSFIQNYLQEGKRKTKKLTSKTLSGLESALSRLVELSRENNTKENGNGAFDVKRLRRKIDALGEALGSTSAPAPAADNDMMYLYRADIDLPEALRIYTGGCLSKKHDGGCLSKKHDGGCLSPRHDGGCLSKKHDGGYLSKKHDGSSKDHMTLPRPETPYFIILYGPPGAGKSSVLRNLHKYTPVKSSDCVNISLDALVESTR